MISIIFEKEDKRLAVQISKTLQSKGLKTDLENSIENGKLENEKIDIAVLILSQYSNNSEKLIQAYNYLFESQINIIPFIVSDLDLSITTKHFLNTHDWINAFDISANKAISDLLILIEEITNSPISEKPKKIVEKSQTIDKKKNQKIAIIAVSATFVIILAYLIFGNKNNNPLDSNSSPKEMIVGEWHLANYQDNMQRTQADYVQFIKDVNYLKENFLLKILENGNFEKYGFAQVEKGNWELDPQKNILYMWPPNSDGNKDQLYIEKLTPDSLIMSIATKIDSLTLVNTKFTLYKQ